MRCSELIEGLAQIVKEIGDVEVYCMSDPEGNYQYEAFDAYWTGYDDESNEICDWEEGHDAVAVIQVD